MNSLKKGNRRYADAQTLKKKNHRLKIEEHCPIDQKSFRDFKVRRLNWTYARYRLKSNVEFWIFMSTKIAVNTSKKKILSFSISLSTKEVYHRKERVFHILVL